MFLRNSWYVFGWAHDLEQAAGPLGRIIIGEPVVLWRDGGGCLRGMEDRCPHRHAPLSLGRVEGATLRCMYHGMTFDTDGHCVGVPLMERPPAAKLRVYPAVEKNDWLWVWMGDPDAADETFIPDAFGVTDPSQPMRSHSIEYAAHYQLIHDNLCDLSHVDFVHSTTLRPVTGADWSATAPRVRVQDRAIHIDRWFESAQRPDDPNVRVDTWSSYDFVVPGIFIMRSARYPAGTAIACGGREPAGIEPLSRNIEQQAVTPISAKRTAYHYATGLIGNTAVAIETLAQRMGVVMAAFEEDRSIIEGQQRIWDLTAPEAPKIFLPQDKAPSLMRQLMRKLIAQEAQKDTPRTELAQEA
jgi:phenylpropionate dioxygenase-like ring-hydroxylating dioxygenase large terminal subunit